MIIILNILKEYINIIVFSIFIFIYKIIKINKDNKKLKVIDLASDLILQVENTKLSNEEKLNYVTNEIIKKIKIKREYVINIINNLIFFSNKLRDNKK